MRKRDDWIVRIKRAEQEWEVATAAVERFERDAQSEPAILPENSRAKDVRRTLTELPATYLVRLFAVFEAGLRGYWREGLERDTAPPMRDLLDGIASARGVQDPFLVAAHRVRAFRNALVHERDDEPESVFTLPAARRHLTRFFSYLPPDW
jgi:hypothetical protein